MKRFIVSLLTAVMVVSIIFAGCMPGAPVTPPPVTPPPVTPPPVTPPPEAPPETVKIGMLGPLSGPVAQWCLPGLTGVNMWVDACNEAGGLQVGDKRYLVEVIPYDDEFIPSKALMGARKLILEDNVVMIMKLTGDPVAAIQPVLNEYEVLCMPFVHKDVHPDWPWTLGITENYPDYHFVSIQYIADAYPELKTMAVFIQEDDIGRCSMACVRSAAEVNDIEVVYDNLYSPETFDFAPIVSAALATNPEIVSLGATYPEFRLLIVEQLYHQGFDGLLESSEWELTPIFAKVPVEFMEHAVAHYPLLDEPMLPERANKFYADWMARYGPGAPEDVHREYYSIDYEWAECLEIWAYGAQLAGSVDPAAVRDALLAQEEIPHIFGPAVWWGEDLFGINHALLSPQWVTEIRGGVTTTFAEYDIAEWFEENKEVAIKWWDHYGVMWYQR